MRPMSITSVAEDPIMAQSRGRWWLPVALIVAVGLLWGGWGWWTNQRYRAAMDEIETDIMAGRNALACRKLVKVLSWKSDPDGGIVYLLGSCELALGRERAARESWERVAPGSKFSERAIRGRMRLFRESGQLAAAERLINDAALDRRNDRTALRVLLVPIYGEQGRIDEAEQLIEDRWEYLNARGEGALEPAIKLVREHIELTLKPPSVETIRADIEDAAKRAPDDDRVWLGRANLAIRTGTSDEARQWLEKCEQRRPDDIAIWRAWLSWAIATNRIDVVQQAMTHLEPAGAKPGQLHRQSAWLASQRGELETERRELEQVLVADPSDQTAVDRLAELAEKAQHPEKAAELRRKKEEIAWLQARYVKLFDRKQPIRDAVEMARLAEHLGRDFEARGFLTVAIAYDPSRADLRRDLKRLSRRPAAANERERIVAESPAHRLDNNPSVDVTLSR